MKSSNRCPKCHGQRIGVIEGVFDEWSIRMADGPFAGASARTGSDLERTAYVCADCGYYETYLSHPEAVDFDHLQGHFRWLGGGQGPFR
jgi:hypothetical protein